MSALSRPQINMLKFADAGGKIPCIRPGSNYAADTEYTYSEGGVAILLDGTELEDLFRREYLHAEPKSEPYFGPDGVECTHEAKITPAGRAALTTTNNTP